MIRTKLVIGGAGTLLTISCAAGQTCSAAWSALDGGLTGTAAEVHSLVVYNDGNGPTLYAGGHFAFAGGAASPNIARWIGRRWIPMTPAPGMADPGTMLVFDDGSGPQIWAAAGFRWNGSGWQPWPTEPVQGVHGVFDPVIVYDDGTGPGFYAAGHFFGNGFNNIARWDGAQWTTVGGGVTGIPPNEPTTDVTSMAVYDDDGSGPRRPGLYVSGRFTHAGSTPVLGIARWDGATWEAVGSGLSSYASNQGMIAFDGEIYVAGPLIQAGGQPVNGIARWNGARWADVGGGTVGLIFALTVFDDGTGPALYAGGSFQQIGNVSAHDLARWDGARWSDPTGGMTGSGSSGNSVRAFAAYDAGSGTGLYAAGGFVTAGQITANNIARWGLPQCNANCDGSYGVENCPTLNVGDFICFTQRFAAHDLRANCDDSTVSPVLNIADFVCFLSAFAGGCP